MGDPEQEVYERTVDENLEVRFPVEAGPRLVGVAFLKETSVPEGPLLPRMTQYDLLQYKGGAPSVASISIGGPYNAKGMGETPSRRKIFGCRPNAVQEQEPCARKILSTLARRAYRRPLTEGDSQTVSSGQTGTSSSQPRRIHQCGARFSDCRYRWGNPSSR